MTAARGSSYPSGHTTTAAVFAVALSFSPPLWSAGVPHSLLGGLYVIAGAGSRVYLTATTHPT